jgi:hypothetical protein
MPWEVSMSDPEFEHEYSYRPRLAGLIVSFLFFGIFLLASLWLAVTDRGAIIIQGILELKGDSAALFRWAVFGCAGMGFVSLGVAVSNRLWSSCQHIVLTPRYLILPWGWWRLREESIAYGDITELTFVTEDVRVDIIGLGIQCPQGVFSINKALLPPGAFKEMLQLLLDRIDQGVADRFRGDYWLNEAARLDREGEWDQALVLYERVAELRKGEQDGEYALNCIRRIQERQDLSQGGRTA